MNTLEIIGYYRTDLTKQDVKKIRNEASVPCVLYGGEKNVHFHVPMILFRDLVYTPNAYFVEMNIEGDIFKCVLQDIQFHPVSETILHADFLLVRDDKPVKMEIPVNFSGNSPGIQQGGKLMVKLKKLKVKSLPKDMPDIIEIDISGIDLGKSVKVKDITVENYEILNAPSNPVASVEIPRALRSKQDAATEEEETEVEA